MKRVPVLAFALVAGWACGQGISSSPDAPSVPATPQTPTPPVTPVGTFGAALVVSSPIVRAGTSGQGVVYVSLPPGTIKPSYTCLLYTSPSPRDRQKSRMPSSA